MSETCLAAVKINQDLCSRCSVCYSICPFEAITRDTETGKVEIDNQKCQVCGICYSACPVTAIEMAYYDYNNLMDYVNSELKKVKADALVVMCRGNSPSSGEISDILKEQGLEVKTYIPLRVPCAGRIPTDFIFNVLNAGVKNIVSVQCEDSFCRMKEGTKIETRRLLLSKAVLKQLGFEENAVQVVKFSRKAVYITEECVGCDKCVFVCPYNAITAQSFATPTIDVDKCTGCGACQLVCPHDAIQVKGFEFNNVLDRYGCAITKLKAQNNSPAVLVFSCQWSEYSGLDDPESVLKGKNALVLEVPCFKSMDPVHVVNAFRKGFDGVMGAVCSETDCKLQEGRDLAERQLGVLKAALKKLGLLDRFEMVELSPRCQGDFESKFEAFYKKIAAMPQCTVADKTEANLKRTK
ncbi:MAG: hydrogenase iron-sulfur subunit [Candidatus Bathyarchaeota archaeon]|nr:hydrogenase iron-sulfur subunit [Candidatus Bathyarchaeota archaeon]